MWSGYQHEAKKQHREPVVAHKLDGTDGQGSRRQERSDPGPAASMEVSRLTTST